MHGRKMGAALAATAVLVAKLAQAQTGTPAAESPPAPVPAETPRAAPSPVAPAAAASPAAPDVPGASVAPAAPPSASEPSAQTAPADVVAGGPDANAPLPEVKRGEALETRWVTALYGFAELDFMHDTTQSYGPASNNAMLARPGTYAGTQPRAQLTANNSQLGLRIAAPAFQQMRATGQVEMDFFGALPADATEQTVYATPSVRLRLFYLRLETPIVDVLAGQYYDVFGWGGAGFFPASVAFLGIAGEVFHRQPQLRVSKTFPGRSVALDLAVAAVRPAQRDAGVPDVEAGLKLSFPGVRGVAAQGFGPPELAPLALGLSAVGRRFAVAEFLPNPGAPKVAFGGGVAVNLFVPLVPVRRPGQKGNVLSLTGELSIGTGIADLYTQLTGGALFPTLPNPGALVPPPLYRPNIDNGLVTFDANGNLETINWRAVVLGVQYSLPIDNGRVWLSVNVSQLKSTNLLSLTPEASRGGIFIQQDYLDANLFGAVTPAVQVGLSFQSTRQVFGDMPFGGAVVPESKNYRGEGAVRLFF